MNKRLYVVLTFSFALASVAYYFYKRSLSFNPTKESAAANVEVVFNP